MKDKLLRAEEIADTFGLKVETIRKWIARGTVGSVKLGKRARRVPEREIAELIKRGYTPARDAVK